MFAIIFGTRPEYLKMKSIINEFQKQDILKYKIIYIQQHVSIDEIFDFSYKTIPIMNEVIPSYSSSSEFNASELSATQLRLQSVNRLSFIGCKILSELPQYIEDCSHILIQGDTATAFYSALTAFQLNKKIIHIEAGLRTYDLQKPFPEEGYRQMISRIASIHFTPHDDCNKVLKDEKNNGKIYNVGNTILDMIQSYNLNCVMNNIVVITFHRRENWDKIDILLSGLKKLIKKTPNIKYIWYLHPNPILKEKVKESIKNISSIELHEPCGHKEFTKQIANSNFLITDSGGIQEEATFLGKHCIVLRASTERSHIQKEYITILEDYSKLDEVVETIPTFHLPPCNVYGKGESAKQIINLLYSNLGDEVESKTKPMR